MPGRGRGLELQRLQLRLSACDKKAAGFQPSGTSELTTSATDPRPAPIEHAPSSPPPFLAMDEIRKIPPVTRSIIGGVLLVTIPILLHLVSAYPIVFVPRRITRNFELWRIVTPFLYGGGGIGFLFDVFLVFRNSSDLEERHFGGRTAEYGAWRFSRRGLEASPGADEWILQPGHCSSFALGSSYVSFCLARTIEAS